MILFLITIKIPLVHARLKFLIFFASLLKKFLILFPTDNQMIPFIKNEFKKMVKQLAQLVFKKSAMDEAGAIVNIIKKSSLMINKIYVKILMLAQPLKYVCQSVSRQYPFFFR